MRTLPHEKRFIAIALLQHGRSICEVSKLLGTSQSTCSTICRECVPHVEPSGGGCPKSITVAQRWAYVRAITVGGLDNVVDMRNALSEHLNVIVSINTVRRVLYEVCLGQSEKQNKALLVAKHVCWTLEFAQCHQDWTIHDCYRVILVMRLRSIDFSLMIVLGVGWGMENLNYKLIMWVRHGAGAIFVWRCMTPRAMGYMCKTVGKMTQALYLSILQDGVMMTIEWYYVNPNRVIFQHDNDPKHVAKLVKQWLWMQNFDVLTWPAQSPNLNPMEQVWALVKRKLNEYPTPTKGMRPLWECMQTSFYIITPKHCQKLYHNMPNCIQVVLASKEGGQIIDL